MKDTTGIILAQNKTDAMRELIQSRTIASVPFGGRYRLIDFTLSNMVNSGIRDVGVVTQSNYYSLMDHLGSGKEWDLNRKKGGLCILPPSVSDNTATHAGVEKIEALYGVLDYIRHCESKYIVISDANLVGQFDYREMLTYHIEKKAYLTAAYQKDVFDPRQFPGNTFIQTDDTGRITDVTNNQIIQLHSSLLLGVYVIERELLEFLVCQCAAHNKWDFERDILQDMVNDLDLYGYCCPNYVERIDSIDLFFQANRNLLDAKIRRALFKNGNILTKVRDEVPTYYGDGSCVRNSVIADGCIIDGYVENSIIFRSVRIEQGAHVKNSIIMQDSIIGTNASVDYCITDKLVTISKGRRVAGADTYPIVFAKGSKI